MAYTKTVWQNSPSTATPINATNLNNIETGIEDVDTRLTTVETDLNTAETDIGYLQTNQIAGWIPSSEAWSFASADDPVGIIYAVGNVTTKYSAGMRIKFTNGGHTIYGIISVVSAYDAGNNRTPITFLHEIDPTDSLALYLMANSTITDCYFSHMQVPYGFPFDPDKWSVTLVDTTTRSAGAATQNTWYNPASLYKDIPIGKWRMGYQCYFGAYSTGTAFKIYMSLSTQNNAETDSQLSSYTEVQTNTGTGNIVNVGLGNRSKEITLAVKTRYYPIIRTTTASGVGNMYFYNGESPFILRAECAYL